MHVVHSLVTSPRRKCGKISKQEPYAEVLRWKIGEINIKKKGKFEQPRKTAAQERAQLEADWKHLTEAANGGPGREPGPRGKGKKTALIVLTCAVLAAVLGAGAWLWSYSRDDGLIFANVYALDVNLGGMTREEAQAVLEEKGAALYAQSLTVRVQDRELVLTQEATGASLDGAALAQAAYDYGREGNMFDRARTRAEAANSSYTLDPGPFLRLDTAYIREAVEGLGDGVDSQLIQPTVAVTGERPDLSPYTLPDDLESGQDRPEAPIVPEDGQTMVIRPGIPRRYLDTEALYTRVLNAYHAGDLSPISAGYDEEQPDPVDLEALYREYCLEPVDAVLNEATYTATKESLGYGFVVEEVQKQLDRLPEGESLEVPFQVLIPEHTKASLERSLFRDLLASAETEHTWNDDRTTNLILACQAIDGYILKPGDTFSFNEVVGERTAAKGYREATVYVGGDSVPGLGGGVCQVSSTIYYCALYADLKIVERYAHQFTVDYVPLGMDATVQWGLLDFRFRNDTDYPIRIEASVHDGVVDVALWGTDDKTYRVEMDYEVLSKTPWEIKEKTVTDGSYDDGETITTPYTGYEIQTYKYKYDKETDALISSGKESYSSYSKRDKVVAAVPKPTEPPETEPPTTAPTDPPEDPPESDGE